MYIAGVILIIAACLGINFAGKEIFIDQMKIVILAVVSFVTAFFGGKLSTSGLSKQKGANAIITGGFISFALVLGYVLFDTITSQDRSRMLHDLSIALLQTISVFGFSYMGYLYHWHNYTDDERSLDSIENEAAIRERMSSETLVLSEPLTDERPLPTPKVINPLSETAPKPVAANNTFQNTGFEFVEKIEAEEDKTSNLEIEEAKKKAEDIISEARIVKEKLTIQSEGIKKDIIEFISAQKVLIEKYEAEDNLKN